MISAAESIETSYIACRRVSRNAKSNFPATFILLPKAKRQAMFALYAFMRHSDDLADSPVDCVHRAEALRCWRQALARALDAPMARSPDLPNDTIGASILPAVCEAIRAYKIPVEHLHAVIDGVEMDLHPQTYKTFDDLEVYCKRVASAVGLSCIYVWGFHGPEAFALSHNAGMALQLTNILRDLKEDASQGRIYLSHEDLEHCGYSPDELRAGIVNAGFLRLMELETTRTDEYYRQAEELLHYLHPDGQRIYGLMMATYRALLHAIRQRPAEVFKKRLRLSHARKLLIAARWACLPLRPKAKSDTA